MSDVQTRIGITPVVIGGAGARSDLRALWQEFKDGKMTVEEFNQEMRNLSGSIYAQRRVIMLMRTEYRNTRAALYEAMRGFRAVARIGRTITSTYMTFTLMQMRVADKTRDVRDTQEDLAKIQERRIRVVKDLGANNAIALRLINEEDRLTKRLTDDRRDLKRAQDQNIIGYVGIGLQTLQIIPTMVALKRHIDLTRLYMGETWSYTGLVGLVTAAGKAKVALFGVQTTLTGLALGVAIPVIITWAVAQAAADLREDLKEEFEETPYWWPEEEPYKPGKIGRPAMGGFDIQRYIGDWWGGLWDDSEDRMPEINITVEEEDIDVQVDVTVTKTGTQDDGEGKTR